ncbi:hypothetical protein I2W78_13120 [Streptomyces spinoverrucosus]|uniref:hypothetical protein n=1 Tax=Streptomyces spinoverrucosus TaxID=284043 RepID=UPI0018C3E4CF|nr:hypothetical protein [Streptomyces spinoverrucosus]MBG0852755.1 hypothetical protein [Streptomyces spinoverrucosus]
MTPHAAEPVFFVSETAVLAVPRHGRIRDVVPQRQGGFRRSSFVERDMLVYEEPGSGRTLLITVDRPVTALLREALVPPEAESRAKEGPAAQSCERAADAFRMPLAHRIRMPGFAALLLTGALSLTLFGVHTFGLGREVTATVTHVEGDSCRITWQDPWDSSRTQRARVDCYQGEKPGDLLRISARPWPVRGEAADLEDSRFMMAFGVTVSGLAALVGIASASVSGARRLRLLRRHVCGGEAALRHVGRVMVPWWSWAAMTLGLAGLGLVTLAYGFGQPVHAEVTGTTEYDTCAVAWADPWDGTPLTAEVDCDGVAAGDLLEVSVLPWPLRGEAFDRDFTPVGLGFVTAFGAGVALLGVGLHSRRSRRGRALVSTAATSAGAAAAPSPAPLRKDPAGDSADTGDILDRSHLTEVSRLLLARDVLGAGPKRRRPEPDPRSGPWWRSPALRRITLASGIAWGALIVLGVTALWSGWWWMTAFRITTDRPQTAIATVEYRHDEFPLEPWLLPGAAEMSFLTADGRRIVTDIVHADPAPAEGDTVGIEYAAGHPSVAWIPGDPGFRRGLWVSGAVAALALARLVWCVVATGRILRRLLRAARRGQVRSLDYLLLPGGEEPATEAPMLVLFEPGAQRPTAVMDVVPGAILLPPEGTLELRSVPQDPSAAVAWIGGEPVWPTSPLTALAEDDEEDSFRQYVTDLVPSGVALDAPPTPG